MPTAYQPLLTDAFLAARWATSYVNFRGSSEEARLLKRLQDWSARVAQKETTAEAAFVGVFFKQTWGYRAAGEGSKSEGYTCEPQRAVEHAGQGGGTGSADLALGYFGTAGVASTPQVLCEFKDVRSGLDKPQKRKGNDRSPVKQCADYLKEAASALYGNEPIQPAWGVVSDMNEFRLYWRRKMPAQYQRFVLVPTAEDAAPSLLGDDDAAAFQRFVFWRLFQHEMLLTTGGPSPLERLLTEQWIQERAIEADFYREYHSFRQEVFNSLVEANQDFKGTRGKLVRLTQRFLDRCLFVLFCEDMGEALKFPQNILRELLIGVSADPDYDPTDDAAWFKVKKLFVAMREGSPFREKKINHFNGGLFAEEPALESLHIPTRIFCAKGQGDNAEALVRHKNTLLFFSANYNFGVAGGTYERTVGLYTLGRIFEQSITELEFMEAKADGRASITELSKRKRDGVYYTPEWITSYIVAETAGAYLAERRLNLGLDPLPVFDRAELGHYRRARASGKKDKRFNTEAVERYVASLDSYADALDDIKILDPACGSGAFLIQALDLLVNERRWLASERERVTALPQLFDTDTVTKAILSKNIYGVDVNEESIEITRLALWLHTALPDRPLSSLDHNIRCGNSLIDDQFFKFKQHDLFGLDERERINAFNWKAAFPEVFNRPGARSGFDCVVGNPPYVKLQHFREVMPAIAEYLLHARRPDGQGPLFESTQTKNFDMYLPFIEKGVSLLNEDGRMGFIAPSVWLLNEYGESLRKMLLANHRLERWVDFKDFPVFDEAMTYTAVQFFRGRATDRIACAFAPDGELGAVEWEEPDAEIDYGVLPPDDVWVFLPKRERELIDRLAKETTRLGDLSCVSAIFQGIITSADHIYHLERRGQGRYAHFPKKKPPVEVEIEDAVMRPLVSGEEAKRYQTPTTCTFLLFPYVEKDGRVRLLTDNEMEAQYPKAWQYLKTHETELRQREKGAFDDEQWFRFGRNQNIDKQKLPKLGVAQTAPELRVFYDQDGKYVFNNVRVNGILTDSDASAHYIMGVLNSRVADFVFRRIAKPKEPRPSGAYFEANKQYIAPIPIPKATDLERSRVAGMAQNLQGLHTERRITVLAIDHRLASDQMRSEARPPKWLWADVGDVSEWAARNTTGLKGRALVAWSKDQVARQLAVHYETIMRAMSFGATMCASEHDGELRFFIGNHCVVDGVFASPQEAPLILAQWRQRARGTFVSDALTAGRLVDWLLDLKTTQNHALVGQILELNRSLDVIEDKVRTAERELDECVLGLYRLSDSQRRMVELDTAPRWESRTPAPPRI